MINFDNVTKSYDDQLALNKVNFEIKDGEFFVLVGSSGSGKTTSLKMINRLIEPTSGNIFIEDKNIKDINKRDLRLDTGYVLQSDALFPNMTVLENVELIVEMKKMAKSKRKELSKKLLSRVGLDPETYLNSYPDQLSGGQAQRVGIVRAIIGKPKILLMDEPFSALDPIIRHQLQDLIKEIHKEFKITTVFVTHNMNEALKLGDRIAIMSKGEVLQVDSPTNIKNNPKNDFVKDFFSQEDSNV